MSVTKAEATVQFPGKLRSIQDLLSLPGPHLDEAALENAIEGAYETDDAETQVVWTRFPRFIVDIMGEIARNENRPYGNKVVALIRHAVYELIVQVAKEEAGDVPTSALLQYVRSQRLLARKAFEAGADKAQQAGLHAVEMLLGKAVDHEIPGDVHKELLDLDELLKGSTHETWKAEFSQRIRGSGMVAKAVTYLVDKWADGSKREQTLAEGWVSWWENL